LGRGWERAEPSLGTVQNAALDSASRAGDSSEEGDLKVFVGFGFNARDRWIRELVFPLLEAFDCEVDTGEEMAGEQLSEGVQRRVASSDALIAFRTQRYPEDPQRVALSHRWVDNELTLAIGRGLLVLEVREEGVDDQGGLAGDRQWLVYREAERDKLLVDLATTVGGWVRTGRLLDFHLLPDEVVAEVKPLVDTPGFRCSYALWDGRRQSPWQETPVRAMAGSLVIQAAGLTPSAYIRVRVEGGGREWASEFESSNSIGINLRPR
jgi:hypothetical protein